MKYTVLLLPFALSMLSCASTSESDARKFREEFLEAIRNGDTKRANEIGSTKGFDMSEVFNEPDDEIFKAIAQKNIDEVKRLAYVEGFDIDAKDITGCTALHRAVLGNEVEIAKFLVKRGANVNIADSIDHLPLHDAANRGNLEMTELLLSRTKDVNARICDGKTALSLAIYRRKLKISEFLVNSGVDVNIKDNEGWLPLHYAAAISLKLMKLLIPRTNINAQTKDGETALHIAAKRNRIDIIELLLENGADKSIKSKDGKTYTDFLKVNDNISGPNIENELDAQQSKSGLDSQDKSEPDTQQDSTRTALEPEVSAPWYKQPWFLVSVGALFVLCGGAAFLVKRSRDATKL